MRAALDRRLGNLGEWLAGRQGDVADREDLGMTGQRQVVGDRDASAATQRDAQQARNRAGGHTGGPDDRACGEPAAVLQHDGGGLDMIDTDAELDGDVPSSQRRRRLLGQARVERSEDAVGRLRRA